MESLANKILAGLGKLGLGGNGRAPDLDDDDLDGRGPPSKVPYHRFREERQARQRLEAALQEVQGQVEQLEAGYKAQLTELQEQAADQVKRIGQRHQEDITLIDAGLTDAVGRKTLRSVWEDLPKDARGKSAAEWWTGVLAQHKAHGEDSKANAAPDVPRPLSPYLPQAGGESKRDTATGTGWPGSGGPPGGPEKREPMSVDSVPIDQGFDTFIQGLQRLQQG